MGQVQLEVTVQDCFWHSDLDATPESFGAADLGLAVADCPISVETWQEWFSQWLERLQPHLGEAVCYELNLRLTNDIEIRALNAQYRSQNTPTDVLAFATLEVACPQPTELLSSDPLYLGDIVISVETAYQQAQQQGHLLKIELAWLATHGLLHLLGWDHPNRERLAQMLNQQSMLLQAINLTVNSTVFASSLDQY